MGNFERLIMPPYPQNDFGLICGGVWTDGYRPAGEFIPVYPAKGDDNNSYDVDTGTLIRALTSESGQVFARLIDVPKGGSSPVWEFAEDANDADLSAYCRWRQRTVMGCGVIDIWHATNDGDPRSVITYELAEPIDSPLRIDPGDGFRIRAASDMGIVVMAVFSGRLLFRNEFVKTVDPATLAGQPV